MLTQSKQKFNTSTKDTHFVAEYGFNYIMSTLGQKYVNISSSSVVTVVLRSILLPIVCIDCRHDTLCAQGKKLLAWGRLHYHHANLRLLGKDQDLARSHLIYRKSPI